MNLFVQILANRVQRVFKKTDGELNWTSGLEMSFMVTDELAGLTSSSNWDGTGGSDCCSVIVRTAAALKSTRTLGEHSGQRGGLPTEKADGDASPQSVKR